MLSATEYPLSSVIIGSLSALLLLYLVRVQAHAMIMRSAKMLHHLCRLCAQACLRAEQRVRFRNHEVTKALAESLMERKLERRFLRIEALVEKDLANYQKLSAQINQQLVAIDEDYEASAVVPAAAPEWVEAVDAIAAIQNNERNSEVMHKILADLHQTVQQHQREVMREHRWTVSARHKLLSSLRPKWRKLGKLLEHIDHNITALRQRLHQVDQHMGQFELLTAGTRQGLMASMLIRFVVALCFVAGGAAVLWFNLQLLDGSLIQMMARGFSDNFPVANVLASMHIVITLMAATMVTESLRITHLLPLTAAMSRRGRYTMLATGAVLLLAMSTIEAAALAGTAVTSPGEASWLSQSVLAILGFVMPVVLALVVMPVEYLLSTVRPVMGSALQLVLHISALSLRLAGAAMLEVGKAVVLAYDTVIFIALGCETLWGRYRQPRQQGQVSADQQLAAKSAIDVPNVTALRFGPTGRADKQSH